MTISDPKAMRALAHPLRLDLLELLVAAGPSTAAQCGRALGVSQASCSFHLRQLAKYGLVEDAGPGPDRRERVWRVPDPRPTIHVATAGQPGSGPVGDRQMERFVVARETEAILDHLDAGRHGGSVVSAIALVTPEEAAELKERWKAMLEPYLSRSPAQDRQAVRYFWAATPLPEVAR
jgi:DNA-binding transcriptional ArsR family regulator